MKPLARSKSLTSRYITNAVQIVVSLVTSVLCATSQPLEPINRRLPQWVQFSGEYRVRVEGFSAQRFQPDSDDHYWLNRLRLNMKLQPLDWLRFSAQAQDSRVFWNTRIPNGPPYQDRLDLRLGWADIGNPDKGRISVRAGRQEISIAEERIVGPSNWGNTSRSFDAVRVTLRPKRVRLDLFASSVVTQFESDLDRHTDGDNLHGALAELSLRGRLQSYLLWRISPRARAESGETGRLDSWTAGFFWIGPLTKSVRFATEMAAQAGSWGPDRIRGWAGHWRVMFPTGDSRLAPALRFDYNHASGDRDPRDGRHGTFELLYPTPHDKQGLADQVGWKNIHHVAGIAEWKPRKAWAFQTKYHTWWLASRTDGVYTAGGALIARDPSGQSGRWVGQEVDVQALGSFGGGLLLGMGVGHVFPGTFLNNVTPGASYTFPYVMMTWKF